MHIILNNENDPRNKLADAQREGWLDGEAHAIGICFGDNPPWQCFDTPEEQFEYDQARDRAFKSVD